MSNYVVRGAILLLIGEFCLAVMAALIKKLSAEVAPETIVFVRNLFGLVALLPIVLRFGLNDLRTQQFPLHLLRAVTGLTAMYGYFHVITYLPLAEAALVKLSAPFFLPIIAFIWLRERISYITIWSIIIGFVGVVFVLRPGASNFQAVALIGLVAAALASCAKVCIRRMATTEPSHRIVFYFGLLATLLSVIPVMLNWQPPPDLTSWLWLAAVGLVGTAGQLFMTQAYRIAKPAKIGPYTYTAVLYASIFGWVFWGETLLWTTVLGCVFIVVAGILNFKKPRPSLT